MEKSQRVVPTKGFPSERILNWFTTSSLFVFISSSIKYSDIELILLFHLLDRYG